MSDSVRPHRRQPIRLHCPWDFPGKNTGVGYHFLLRCMKVKSESEVAQSYPTQRPHGLQPTRLLRPWDFPGTSTGVGCHCLPWSSESQTPRAQGFSSLWNSLGSADLSNPIFQSRKYDHASFKMQPLAHGCPGKQDCLVKPKSEQGFPANICLPCASLV